MPLQSRSSATGRSARAVRRDVQAMIDAGWFEPSSYIDDELGCFALNFEAAQSLRAERHTPPAPARTDDPYMNVIMELRSLNESIIDIGISDKVNKIETITAKIFRAVEDDPAKLPQIRRFLSYYLPSTLKLIRSYAALEKHGEPGENISAAKESINGVLDMLSTGFEQQLDKLFRSDAIDITSDINVLERMMESDGLMGSGPLSGQAALRLGLTKRQ
ncbi:MAG: 5-bromo-4-chloroindolyl phosphate hydrolysis family protein [Oscillospiraceae bacterium]|nr:5-bromo-4-chloroindolyl phosphate hydrolysis family protein [Oscillospiraceae bacterium]